jgi:Zn-dependent protease/predicted transcriptional regulator
MSWSIPLGRLFGIRFRVHLTFLLLLGFIFVTGAAQKGTKGGLTAALFICAIFACVVIHELAHSLIARRFGKEVKSIILLPIGGLANMEEIPEKPSQEILMAAVGPLINLVIAAVLYLAVGSWTGVGEPNIYPADAREFVAGLIGANIILAIFNIIPAFPMDGGRVLRGILAVKLDYVQATSVAVAVGQALAMVFIFVGLLSNWWLALIGFFLYIGAGSEKQHVILRAALRGVAAEDVMVTDFTRIRPDERLAQVIERVYHGCQDDFPVLDDSGLCGVLTRNRLLAAIHENGLEVTVADVMDKDYLRVTAEMPLEKVYKQLLAQQKTAAAVLKNDQLIGIICHDSIGRLLAIRSALSGIDTPPMTTAAKQPLP